MCVVIINNKEPYFAYYSWETISWFSIGLGKEPQEVDGDRFKCSSFTGLPLEQPGEHGKEAGLGGETWSCHDKKLSLSYQDFCAVQNGGRERGLGMPR